MFSEIAGPWEVWFGLIDHTMWLGAEGVMCVPKLIGDLLRTID